jgi:hypothetical protein
MLSEKEVAVVEGCGTNLDDEVVWARGGSWDAI